MGCELFENYREILILAAFFKNWDETFSEKFPVSIQEQLNCTELLRFNSFRAPQDPERKCAREQVREKEA